MRKINTLLFLFAMLTICIPTYGQPSAQTVQIHMDATDNCPLYTRVIGPRSCSKNNKIQSDAICVNSGDSIKWQSTGNIPFTLVQKSGSGSIFNSCVPAANVFDKTHVCTITLVDPPYRYDIVTDVCVLDPRILRY
jgi:hypothetical protein